MSKKNKVGAYNQMVESANMSYYDESSKNEQESSKSEDFFQNEAQKEQESIVIN